MNKFRSISIKDIDDKLIGEQLVVAGWIENIHDLGGVLFLDLRDETGTLQTVSNDDMFKGLAKESVVKLTGVLRKREEESFNDRIATGKLELFVNSLEMLGESLHDLPFEIMTSKQIQEDVRLKYRYLDMRNVLHFIRKKMYDKGFMEVQAFSTSASGADLMMGSPSEITKEQLEELGIKIEVEEDE